MRVSVTVSDDINKMLVDYANKKGLSKDKLISLIVDDWIDMCRKGNKRDYDKLVAEVEQLREQLKSKHNERGAGRKSKFSDLEICEMKDYKDQGYTYKHIAEIFKCSVGLVHKLINE